VDESDDEKQNHGTDGGVDDCADQAGGKNNPELGQQPTSRECADDAHNQISDETKSAPPNDLTGQPAGNDTDQNNDQ